MRGVGSSAGQGRLAMAIGGFSDKPLEHCAQKHNLSAQNQYGQRMQFLLSFIKQRSRGQRSLRSAHNSDY